MDSYPKILNFFSKISLPLGQNLPNVTMSYGLKSTLIYLPGLLGI